MKTRVLPILNVLFFTVLACPAFGQTTSSISVDEPRCLPLDGQARVFATATSARPVTSMRVLFRSDTSSADHFIEMRPAESGRNQYWAILPRVLPATKSVNLSILLRTVDGVQVRSRVQRMAPAKSCPITLSREELLGAKNLVIGQTQPGQAAFPAGFDCADIIKQITSTGLLQPVPSCQPSATMASAPPPAGGGGALAGPASSPSSGPSNGGLVIGGVGGTSVSPGVIQGQSSPARPTPGPKVQ